MDACKKTLEDYIAKCQSKAESCLESQLMLAYLPLLESNNIEAAIPGLRGIQGLAHQPKMVAALMGMYKEINQPSGAIEVLEEAIDHWGKSKKTNHEAILKSYLTQAATLSLSNHLYKNACTFYEQLLSFTKDPDERKLYASNLVIACAHIGEVQKVMQYSHFLPGESILGNKKVDLSALDSFTKRKKERKDVKSAADGDDEKTGNKKK